jgi:hypothetical protein
MMRFVTGPMLLAFVLAAATSCGAYAPGAAVSLQPGAAVSLQPGTPHCSAAETAAAREQQAQPQNPTASQASASVGAQPTAEPTTGSPPPAPTPLPTAVPIVVTAATLNLGPNELSQYPSPQYVVHVGAVVNVVLPDEASPFCWSIPTTTAPSVLAVVDAGDSLGGGAHARLRASAPGVATVTTTSACYTFPPCGAPIAITQAVITVRP